MYSFQKLKRMVQVRGFEVGALHTQVVITLQDSSGTADAEAHGASFLPFLLFLAWCEAIVLVLVGVRGLSHR
jgi:hypothetical protein